MKLFNMKSKDNVNNHHVIIRHFKTRNDKINYSRCYDEATPYIDFLKSYPAIPHIFV